MHTLLRVNARADFDGPFYLAVRSDLPYLLKLLGYIQQVRDLRKSSGDDTIYQITRYDDRPDLYEASDEQLEFRLNALVPETKGHKGVSDIYFGRLLEAYDPERVEALRCVATCDDLQWRGYREGHEEGEWSSTKLTFNELSDLIQQMSTVDRPDPVQFNEHFTLDEQQEAEDALMDSLWAADDLDSAEERLQRHGGGWNDEMQDEWLRRVAADAIAMGVSGLGMELEGDDIKQVIEPVLTRVTQIMLGPLEHTEDACRQAARDLLPVLARAFRPEIMQEAA